ncbi:ATP-grasp fold amidoligase family protein [Facklamia sp. P12934]|uniref:ATP-grasp fold amidoligase family protein n=1 Tax=Facklamia sp. P12934 TaxID=3421948 RepID=UPI003D180056
MKNKIKMLINNPQLVLQFILNRSIFKYMNDENFIKLKYRIMTGKKLNLENPQTFNEKLQWLKLYNRNREYTKLVDKFSARNFVKHTIGEKYLNEIFGVYNSYDEINFDLLPEQFVLKPTHASGNYYICKDKSKINHKELKKTVNIWMNRNYYLLHREWPYKNVKPRILAEKFLESKDGSPLVDYRFLCFNGDPKIIFTDLSMTDKSNTRRNIYNLNWNLLDYRITYPIDYNINLTKPKNLNEMINLSRRLSKDIPHVRVDFYNIDGKIIFSEMTFFHQSGYGKFYQDEFAEEMGAWINLPSKKEE